MKALKLEQKELEKAKRNELKIKAEIEKAKAQKKLEDKLKKLFE